MLRERMSFGSAWVLLACGILAGGCRGGLNYLERDAPRYSQPAPPGPPAARQRGDTLRIVTFNIAFSRKLDTAIAVLSNDAMLRGADVIFLQEMTARGTQRIAGALQMGYVYYPAIYHYRSKQDFGNAVLSRWPIVADEKLILPNRSRYARTQRTATAATILIDSVRVRAYSSHLGTVFDIGSGSRRAQLETIVNDAKAYPRAIIGGDMNTASLGDVVRQGGLAWPTEHGARTTRFGRWDHVLVRGFDLPTRDAAGVSEERIGASDHKAVWVSVLLPRS